MHIDKTAWIETSKGRPYYYAEPVFDAEEIAHAIGNQSRYTGHCRHFYSTAEHSLLVALIMEQKGLGDPFEGLMHDSHEAYLGDVNSPLKSLLPDYKRLEKFTEGRMRAQYKLAPKMSAGCKFADIVALAIEAKVMMVTKGRAYSAISDEHRNMANGMPEVRINFWLGDVARDHWLAAFGELGRPRGFLA